MPRKTQPRPTRRRAGPLPGKARRSQAKGPARGVTADLLALSERLDMMLPELIARVAAVEHLLVEKGLCAHEDLLSARRFIDEQESW